MPKCSGLVLLCLLFLANASLSAAQAAVSGGPVAGSVGKRPLFRPLSHTELGADVRAGDRGGGALQARRPPSVTPQPRRQFDATLIGGRAGARKAVPVTRGQELGLRFRPDERQPDYGYAGAARPQQGQALQPDAGQDQFRPTPRRRKPTYEELHAETSARPAQEMVPAPVLPYPMMTPPPMPGYGSRWPTW